MRKHHGRALLATILAATTLAACSEDAPTTPGNGNGDAPGAGTSFTYQGVTSTATGQVIQSMEMISVVVETGQSYFGRDGLVKMVTGGAPAYLSYSNAGDMSTVFYVTMNGRRLDSMWVTLPYGSKGSTTYPSVDRMLSGMRVTSNGTIQYVGPETITAAGETFETERVRVVANMSMGLPSGGPGIGTNRIDTIWYAPRVKYHVRQSGIQHSITGDDTLTVYNVATLKSYSLK